MPQSLADPESWGIISRDPSEDLCCADRPAQILLRMLTRIHRKTHAHAEPWACLQPSSVVGNDARSIVSGPVPGCSYSAALDQGQSAGLPHSARRTGFACR
jgi:hypothetical protein